MTMLMRCFVECVGYEEGGGTREPLVIFCKY